MCRATTCKTCGKTTWTGCGDHVDAVRAQVPAEQWCAGHSEPSGSWLSRRFAGGKRRSG
jgi:hypothetical protein